MKVRYWILLVVSAWLPSSLLAQRPEINYDESKVQPYTLPDPLALDSGRRVTDKETWIEKRRPEILKLFETHVYGKRPGQAPHMSFGQTSIDHLALGGKATRKQVSIYLASENYGTKIDVLVYVPNQAKRPVPAFLVLNFGGNHSVHSDPGIDLSQSWMHVRSGEAVEHRATEKSRGVMKHRWPVEKIISRGYAFTTIYYGDVDPDFDDGFQNGVHPLFYKDGHTQPKPDEWGSIAAWTWGLSRTMDYFEADGDIDSTRVAVLGHSRLGKTALWAAAQDERFAMAISNNSGCGGAALSRRRFGETVEAINTRFPHWFCDNFNNYNGREGELPVDQHMLISLIAPRPVYVASAVEDRWADPQGEFLAAKHASPVYALFGREGVQVESQPAVDEAVMTTIGYHVRAGKHDVMLSDWERYLEFADRHLMESK